MNAYVIAEYLRLSSEDVDLKDTKKTESNSISNQRELLNAHLEKIPEFVGAEVIEFCDDGWSGKNFERPAVQDMLAQVRQGKIQCVIVKDACDIIRLNAKPLWHNGLAFSSKILVAFLTPLLFGISRGVLIFL